MGPLYKRHVSADRELTAVYGLGMRPLDTTDEAYQVQLDAYRAMGEDRRTEMAFEMSEQLRLITLDGLRERNPGADETELVVMLIDLWHGEALGTLVRQASSDR
jgi:hypothetical protein